MSDELVIVQGSSEGMATYVWVRFLIGTDAISQRTLLAFIMRDPCTLPFSGLKEKNSFFRVFIFYMWVSTKVECAGLWRWQVDDSRCLPPVREFSPIGDTGAVFDRSSQHFGARQFGSVKMSGYPYN